MHPSTFFLFSVHDNLCCQMFSGIRIRMVARRPSDDNFDAIGEEHSQAPALKVALETTEKIWVQTFCEKLARNHNSELRHIYY